MGCETVTHFGLRRQHYEKTKFVTVTLDVQGCVESKTYATVVTAVRNMRTVYFELHRLIFLHFREL